MSIHDLQEVVIIATKNYEARVTATLVQGSLQQAIDKEAKNANIKLSNVTVYTSKLVSEIEKALNKTNFKINVTGLGQQIGQQLGQGITKQVQSSLKSIDIKNGGLGNMTRMLQGAGFDKNAIAAITSEFERMSIAVTKIRTTMEQNGNIKMNITGVDELNRAVTIIREFDKETGKVVNTSKSYTQTFIQQAKAVDATAEAAKKAKKEAAELAKAQKEQAKAAKEIAQQQLTLTRANTLSNNIQAWMNNNTTAAQHFKTELASITTALANPNLTGKQLQQLSAQFQNIKARANSAGMVVKQFAVNLKNIGLMALGINSTYAAITKLIQVIRQGAQTVIDLDTALVDLKKTTTMTDNDLAQFYVDANEEAKRLGVTTKEIIEQAADWSRLGYGSKEDATRMASLSSQFAMISPGMSVQESQESLVSTMKAFGIATDEVLDGVMSKINIVGNNFALSNKDIAEALQVTSASMSAANNSFEQTLALITAGTEITQDASKVGNGLRTISMRIRGLDEETGEFDETLGNIKSDISELTNGKVSIMQDANTYKSTYDILKRISEIWDELTDVQQAGLIEKLFGKNRGQIGVAILSNFQSAESAMEKMANSAGNATQEMSIIMESLEYKLNALKQTGVGIWQNLFPREDLGNAIDLLTKIASVIEKVTGFLGPLGTLLTGGTLFALFKNLGWPLEGILYSDIIELAYDGQEHAIMAA